MVVVHLQNLNRPDPLLYHLSMTSSLLRSGPPPLSYVSNVADACGSQRDNDFSCSVQMPLIGSCLLYPGCYMTTRSGHASYFVIDTNVLSTFNITELPYEASITSLRSSALYQLPAEIQFPLFRIVHHNESFRSMQHSVV